MGALVLKSENQILGSQIAKFLAETGLNDLNAGSVLYTLLEANAQELFQQYVQLLNIIRNFNLDTTTDADLDARGSEFGVTRNLAQKASSTITISRDDSFVKVSTSFYSGLPAPVSGDTIVRVNDASSTRYGSAGTLVIGRGTVNEEEVTYTAAPTNFVNYWQFTTSPFSNSHGLDESVILKQGSDQTIQAGTIIRVPATGTSSEIQFTVSQDTLLLAGEDKVINVDIIASVAGSASNIPVGAIVGPGAFVSPPFIGAQAYNDSKFSNGQDREIDDDYRNRIKDHIQSLSNATKTAIYTAIIGLVDSETAKRVVSANIILPTQAIDPVKIYIDDGTGFEPSFDSQGLETLLTQATGGETRLQLDLAPLVKAQVETNLAEPFNMSAGTLALNYTVGLQSETIQFLTSDFSFPLSATADEIVAAINNKATLIEARTSDGGSKIVISAVSETNEDIQVTGGAANGILNFPTDQRSTLYLYVDDQLLSKDGSTAYLDSGLQQSFNFAGLGASPWPLNVVVDGKTANPQVVDFVEGDFAIPSAATASEVVAAINGRLVGAVATVLSSVKVRLASNTLLSAGSKIRVTGGSANSVLGFSTTQALGSNEDYTLNRELGSIELNQALIKNQNVTAGSLYTRARLRTASAELYNITSGQTLVLAVDGGSPQTVTFGSTGLFTALQVAQMINAQLFGATAIVRTIAELNYLEINTNTYTQSVGSLSISSSSTAAALNFPFDQTQTNQRPNRAFVTNSGAGPFAFVLSQGLVVVIDNDPANKTFTILFDYAGVISNVTDTSHFAALTFNTVFPSNSDLVNFWLVAKSGANTTTGSVASVTAQGSNVFRYAFASAPTHLSSFAAGDHVLFGSLTNPTNNGSFLISNVNASGAGYIDVINTSGVGETGSAGSAQIGARRQITGYVGTTGGISLGSALPFAPSVSDQFGVLPSTLKNAVAYMNNKKVSTLSTKASVDISDVSGKAQISSLANGSDGYVQVTGGSANTLLGFATAPQRGLQAYNHYTGLLEAVHKTIYGDDQDLVTFPGVGAAGIQFRILAPTILELNFVVDLTLAAGVSITTVENDVRGAITGYVNGLGVGDDVILSEIIQAIMGVDGIKDVQIVSPAQNSTVADNELARTSDARITVG